MISDQPQLDSNTNEVSISDLINQIKIGMAFVLKRWIIIIAFGTVGALIGLAYAYLTKPIYSAATTFVLEDGGSSSGGMLGQYAGLASMAGIELGSSGGGIFSGENIFELYKSRTMVQKTLLSTVSINGKQQLLVDRYIEFNHLREKWAKKEINNVDFHLQDGKEFTRLQDSLMGKMVEDINTNHLFVSKPDKKLSIIKVVLNTEDEAFSKSFNDKIVQNVNDFYVYTKVKKSKENVAILQHQTDSVKNVLNGAIYTTMSVADATPNLNPVRQVLRASAQRSQFNAEANKAILTQLVQNLELSKLALRKETPLIQVIDTPVYPLTVDKISKLKGLIFGFAFFAFLTVLVLISKFFIRKSYLNG